MDPSALARLNERQRQCLRLFHANFEVKEIAAQLELSPHTVNEHLRDARRTLGVSRSMQAARMLAEAEGNNRPVPEAFGVVPAPPPADEVRAIPETAPVPELPDYRYDLSVLQRIGLIIAIAVGTLALAGATIVGAYAITQILQARGIDISDEPYRR